MELSSTIQHIAVKVGSYAKFGLTFRIVSPSCLRILSMKLGSTIGRYDRN
jgi:hypothetical protein